MNRVVLIGRLTKDPDLRFTPGQGKPVATLNIAVNRRRKKDGKDEADFIRIIVWGKQAESTSNYMTKGRLIGISGRIQTGSYQAKDGTTRYTTDVVADEVQFLDYAKKDDSKNTALEDQSGAIEGVTPVDDGGDIPF